MAERREPWVRYTAMRVRRHVGWLRSQGLGRLVEEDRLNPFDRAATAAGRWRWRLANRSRSRGGVPILLVGLQRSGTNMLVRGLERAPEFEVYNENNKAAFSRFRLRSDPVVRRLVDNSRHPYVLVKPLCDSHRTAELLDGLGAHHPGRALWVYRSPDGRTRSALAKFGDANLTALREIAAGRGGHRWEAQLLSRDSLDLLGSFDWRRMDAASAAALFWVLRNRLYFDLGLDRRPDVLLVSYDAALRDPEAELRRICEFVGFPYRPQLTAHIQPRPPATAGPLDIERRVRACCDALAARLDAVHQGHPTSSAPN